MGELYVNFGAKTQKCLKVQFCQNLIFEQKSGISNSVGMIHLLFFQIRHGIDIIHFHVIGKCAQ